MAASDSETSAEMTDDATGDIFDGMGLSDKEADAAKTSKGAADAALMPPPASPTKTAGTCVYCHLMCGVSSIALVHLFWLVVYIRCCVYHSFNVCVYRVSHSRATLF